MSIVEWLIATAGFFAAVCGALIAFVIWQHGSPAEIRQFLYSSAPVADPGTDDESSLRTPVSPRTRGGKADEFVADAAGSGHASGAEAQVSLQ
ncbi:hypothetical protein BH10ACT7_BH10ACT7_07980 [soil metagenome]